MERVTIVVSLVIFVIVVFTAVFKWAAYKERKQADRRKALQSFADSAGLSYSDSQVPLLGLLIGDERDPEGGALSRFHLLRLGRNDYFHNVVSSFTDTFDLHVSDYYYNNRTTGQQTYQEWDQSVFLYHHEGLELPFFSLRPANILSKAGAALGQQSGLHERTGLSADHEVSADDEEAVQQLFSPDLVTYCNEHPEVFIEGDGTCLILYRRAVLVPADELDAFLKEGLQVLEMVTQSA